VHEQNQPHYLAQGVALVCNAHGREFIEISHSLLCARISIEGAQIISHVPVGQEPLLWLSPEEPELPGIPLRGGIPLCWPWFGDDRQGPAHGIARISKWEIEDVAVSESSVRIILVLPQAEITRQLPAEQWNLKVELLLSDELEVRLTSTNCGTQPQPLSQALHTYLPVSDIHHSRVVGLNGLSYVDQLTGKVTEQQGDVQITEEVDRIYFGDIGTLRLLDGDKGRIDVECAGSCSSVIWNPWQDKARRLKHFPSEGYRQMLCIETANAGTDTRHLQPGETQVLTTRISRCLHID
jgi:glucose-6-phosphate 1-epimerase